MEPGRFGAGLALQDAEGGALRVFVPGFGFELEVVGDPGVVAVQQVADLPAVVLGIVRAAVLARGLFQPEEGVVGLRGFRPQFRDDRESHAGGAGRGGLHQGVPEPLPRPAGLLGIGRAGHVVAAGQGGDELVLPGLQLLQEVVQVLELPDHLRLVRPGLAVAGGDAQGRVHAAVGDLVADFSAHAAHARHRAGVLLRGGNQRDAGARARAKVGAVLCRELVFLDVQARAALGLDGVLALVGGGRSGLHADADRAPGGAPVVGVAVLGAPHPQGRVGAEAQLGSPAALFGRQLRDGEIGMVFQQVGQRVRRLAAGLPGMGERHEGIGELLAQRVLVARGAPHAQADPPGLRLLDAGLEPQVEAQGDAGLVVPQVEFMVGLAEGAAQACIEPDAGVVGVDGADLHLHGRAHHVEVERALPGQAHARDGRDEFLRGGGERDGLAQLQPGLPRIAALDFFSEADAVHERLHHGRRVARSAQVVEECHGVGHREFEAAHVHVPLQRLQRQGGMRDGALHGGRAIRCLCIGQGAVAHRVRNGIGQRAQDAPRVGSFRLHGVPGILHRSGPGLQNHLPGEVPGRAFAFGIACQEGAGELVLDGLEGFDAQRAQDRRGLHRGQGRSGGVQEIAQRLFLGHLLVGGGLHGLGHAGEGVDGLMGQGVAALPARDLRRRRGGGLCAVQQGAQVDVVRQEPQQVSGIGVVAAQGLPVGGQRWRQTGRPALSQAGLDLLEESQAQSLERLGRGGLPGAAEVQLFQHAPQQGLGGRQPLRGPGLQALADVAGGAVQGHHRLLAVGEQAVGGGRLGQLAHHRFAPHGGLGARQPGGDDRQRGRQQALESGHAALDCLGQAAGGPVLQPSPAALRGAFVAVGRLLQRAVAELAEPLADPVVAGAGLVGHEAAVHAVEGDALPPRLRGVRRIRRGRCRLRGGVGHGGAQPVALRRRHLAVRPLRCLLQLDHRRHGDAQGRLRGRIGRFVGHGLGQQAGAALRPRQRAGKPQRRVGQLPRLLHLPGRPENLLRMRDEVRGGDVAQGFHGLHECLGVAREGAAGHVDQHLRREHVRQLVAGVQVIGQGLCSVPQAGLQRLRHRGHQAVQRGAARGGRGIARAVQGLVARLGELVGGLFRFQALAIGQVHLGRELDGGAGLLRVGHARQMLQDERCLAVWRAVAGRLPPLCRMEQRQGIRRHAGGPLADGEQREGLLDPVLRLIGDAARAGGLVRERIAGLHRSKGLLHRLGQMGAGGARHRHPAIALEAGGPHLVVAPHRVLGLAADGQRADVRAGRGLARLPMVLEAGEQARLGARGDVLGAVERRRAPLGRAALLQPGGRVQHGPFRALGARARARRLHAAGRRGVGLTRGSREDRLQGHGSSPSLFLETHAERSALRKLKKTEAADRGAKRGRTRGRPRWHHAGGRAGRLSTTRWNHCAKSST
ncbi:hypothetical protein ACAN107058_10260 [Paracidovorax anthurii]